MCYERRRAEAWTLDFGLWRSYSAVTVSSAGPKKLFKGMTTATSPVWMSPLITHSIMFNNNI